MLRRTLLTAEVVYNGLGTPRSNGGVVVQDAAGQLSIVGIDQIDRLLETFPDADREHVGFALSPPPVNAHTHLDLSGLPYARSSYADFIGRVVAHDRSGKRGLEAAKRGVEALLAGGVGVVGDIVTSEAVMHFLLAHPDLSGVAYWEVFGPLPEEAEHIFDETVERLRAFREFERPGGVRVGISPHTPHTVSAPLLVKLAGLARSARLPMQIHVAESPAELALYRTGGGPIRESLGPLLRSWRPAAGSPLRYLSDLGVLAVSPTLVHMVQVDEEDVRLVQRAGAVVVHCPRSNDALGCGRFPWDLYARHGVSVAFGTDSLGSSPSLAVEEEVAFAGAQQGRLASPLALVRAAVKGGYRALGMTPPRFVRGDSAEALYRWRLPSLHTG